MKEAHDFTTPRNLYEKLIRDSERLDAEISGDNMFNFMATAYRLQAWIKKSPLIQHETVKRLIRKAGRNENLKLCFDILEGKTHFLIEFDEDYPHPLLKIDDQTYNPADFKNEIVAIFTGYFSVK